MTLWTLNLEEPIERHETLELQIWRGPILDQRTVIERYSWATKTIRQVLVHSRAQQSEPYHHIKVMGLGSGREYFAGSPEDLQAVLDTL